MKARLIAAAVLIPVLLLVVLAAPKWLAAIVIGLLLALAAYEMLYRTHLVRHPRLVIWSAIMAFAVSIWSYFGADHSIGVALIIWHFTHDKKQTLAGLFHDIATPAFKHCVDFMNGDYMTQESTEELTTQIIENSPEITTLLERDKIKISEVDNYHLYPIADNDTPKLSADRLEYFLAHGLFTYRTINFDQAKMFYQDIEVEKDRQGVLELGFKTKKIAQDFIRNVCILSTIFHENRTRFSLNL